MNLSALKKEKRKAYDAGQRDERQECLKIAAVIKMKVDMVGQTVMGKVIQAFTASEVLDDVIEAIKRRGS